MFFEAEILGQLNLIENEIEKRKNLGGYSTDASAILLALEGAAMSLRCILTLRTIVAAPKKKKTQKRK